MTDEKGVRVYHEHVVKVIQQSIRPPSFNFMVTRRVLRRLVPMVTERYITESEVQKAPPVNVTMSLRSVAALVVGAREVARSGISDEAIQKEALCGRG